MSGQRNIKQARGVAQRAQRRRGQPGRFRSTTGRIVAVVLATLLLLLVTQVGCTVLTHWHPWSAPVTPAAPLVQPTQVPTQVPTQAPTVVPTATAPATPPPPTDTPAPPAGGSGPTN